MKKTKSLNVLYTCIHVHRNCRDLLLIFNKKKLTCVITTEASAENILWVRIFTQQIIYSDLLLFFNDKKKLTRVIATEVSNPLHYNCYEACIHAMNYIMICCIIFNKKKLTRVITTEASIVIANNVY